MSRILLFIGTNLAIVFVLSIAMSLLGFEGYLDSQGVDLDLTALLVFAAMLGFGGSLISLFISKLDRQAHDRSTRHRTAT